MAVTYTQVSRERVGTTRKEVGSIAFDSSYPTGGEALALAVLGLTEVDEVRVGPHEGYTFEYDAANEKVLAYWVDTTTDGAALAQVVDTTDISSAAAVPIVAYGR